MTRFYFHLCAPDQVFADNIGSELSDLSAAHARALLLADRVMTIFGLADRTSDFRKWTVRITDDRQQPLITVKFPAYFPREKWKSVPSKGVRPLLRQLDAMIRASRQAKPSAGEQDSTSGRAVPRRNGRARAGGNL
jgi:hypothetical protein